MQCIHGFPNGFKGRGIPPVGDRMRDFAGEGGYQVVGIWWVTLTLQTFLKAKNNIF